MSSLSSGEAGLIVFAVVSSSLAAAYFQVEQARRRESTRDRLIREAHERADQAARTDDTTLARAAGPAEPDWTAEGRARVLKAVADYRKGEA